MDIIYLCPALPSSVLQVAAQVCITKLYPLPLALRLLEVIAERSHVCQPKGMAAFLLTLLAGRARQMPLRWCRDWGQQEAVVRCAAWLLLQQGSLAGGHSWPRLLCAAVGSISSCFMLACLLWAMVICICQQVDMVLDLGCRV